MVQNKYLVAHVVWIYICRKLNLMKVVDPANLASEYSYSSNKCRNYIVDALVSTFGWLNGFRLLNFLLEKKYLYGYGTIGCEALQNDSTTNHQIWPSLKNVWFRSEILPRIYAMCYCFSFFYLFYSIHNFNISSFHCYFIQCCYYYYHYYNH